MSDNTCCAGSRREARTPIFADFWPIFVFLALILKIQTTITSSILGVRSSSLDGRQLSTIPFNNATVKTLKNDNTKYINPGQTDSKSDGLRTRCANRLKLDFVSPEHIHFFSRGLGLFDICDVSAFTSHNIPGAS